MTSELGITFLSDEEIDSTPDEAAVVTLKISGRNSVAVGRLLDLIEHAAVLGGLECVVDAPGYHQVFYGWEKKPRG